MADIKVIKLNANGEFQKHDSTNDSIQIQKVTLTDASSAPLVISYTGVITNLNAAQVGSKSESDFILASGARSLSGNWDAGAYTISSSVAPTTANHLTNKSYVDGLVSGLVWKTPVIKIVHYVKADAGAPSGTGLDGEFCLNTNENKIYAYTTSWDAGTALSSGDRYLFAIDGDDISGDSGTSTADNKIYAYDGASTTGTSPGTNWAVIVSQDSLGVGADSGWTYNDDDTSWVQFSGAGQIGAGDGLSKDGNTLNVDLFTNGGLEFSSSQLKIKLAIENGLTLGASGLDTVLLSGGGLGKGASGLYVNCDDLDGDGIKVVGAQFAVEPADFAGNGLQDDGSDNLEIKLVANSGLSVDGSGLTLSSSLDGNGLDLTDGVLSLDLKDDFGLAIDTGELKVVLDGDGGLEFNGASGIRLKAGVAGDGLTLTTGALSVSVNGIDTTHIDWGTTDDQISALDVPVGTAWGGTATDVDAALEELRDNYLPLAGGTMTGDIDMDGNDLLNVGNTSISFVSGAKIIADNFDTSGNFILADEVDDSTLAWSAGGGGVQQSDNFDAGTSGNDIAASTWPADHSTETIGTWYYEDLIGSMTFSTAEFVSSPNSAGGVTASGANYMRVTAIDDLSFDIEVFVSSTTGMGNSATIIFYYWDAAYTSVFSIGLSSMTGEINVTDGSLAQTDQSTFTEDVWTTLHATYDKATGAVVVTGDIGAPLGITVDAGYRGSVEALSLSAAYMDGPVYYDDMSIGEPASSAYAYVKALGVGTAQLAADAVGDGQIDWATAKAAPTGNQIGASSIPVSDGWGGTASYVDAALEELRTSVGSVDSFKTISDGTNTAVAADYDTLTIEPASGSPITVVVSDVAGVAKVQLDIGVDDATIEVSGGSLQVVADGIDATHIDWGSTGDQIDASYVPLDSAGTYTGAATNVQDSLEETLYIDNVGGDYKASADLDMNGNDIINVGNTSLSFVSGAKVIAANFDSAGNIILEDEVDDSTLEWVAGVDDFVSFDGGSAGNEISTTEYVNDGTDPLYTWRATSGKKGADPAFKYQSAYRYGATGNGAGAVNVGGADPANRSLVTRVTDVSSGTFTYSGRLYMKGNQAANDYASLLLLFTPKNASTTSTMSAFLGMEVSGTGTVNVYEKNTKSALGTAASAVTLDGSEHTFSVVINLDTKKISVNIAGSPVIDEATYAVDNEIIGAITMVSMTSSKGTEASVVVDDLTIEGYTPSGVGYMKVKASSIGSGEIVADSVNTTHIDWGTTGDQVSATDVPTGATTLGNISGAYFTGEVGGALVVLEQLDFAPLTAGETLIHGNIVAINSLGKVVKAQADTGEYYQAVGIMAVSSGVSEDDTAYIQVDRRFTKSNFLTGIGSAGDVIYLSSTVAGGYTATEPTAANTVVKKIGIKINDGSMLLAWGPTILN